MKLVIVESPTKARTLSKFLGKEYQIKATMGHIRDLPKKELGVDVENNFAPSYVISSDKKETVETLKKKSVLADKIILATDPDREGEAIAYHVFVICSNQKSKIKNQKFSRIVFHEITESAIKEALLNPRPIDINLVDAQQARRVLDRLVGYKLSPLLWKKIRRGLSAGRVQSVAVRLIVEREKEIEKFKEEKFFRIEGKFAVKDKNSILSAELVSREGIKYEEILTFELFDGKYSTAKTTIASLEQAQKIISDLKGRDYEATEVETKEIRRYPLPPLITSTLQQEGGKRFGFSSKKTMQLAQKLYEEGLITYHRTDSVNLAEKFLWEAKKFIEKEYGRQFSLEFPRRYQTKSKLAQEAHEAVRPTDLKVKTVGGKEGTTQDHGKLYDLIWKRALACQAKEAVFNQTIIGIGDSVYLFRTRGSVVKFSGFLKIAGYDIEDKILPHVEKGEKLALSEAVFSGHSTSPPPRYTEAGLIKTLEEKGIGRPSTYAPIISTIEDRQYVEKVESQTNRQGNKFAPTSLGLTVNDFLVRYFSDIVDIPFTVKMEDEFDEIARGEIGWRMVISQFYKPFSGKLNQVEKEAGRVKIPVEETGEICPDDGGKLIIRIGRFGKFLACGNFPKCRFTKPLLQKTGLVCPKCQGEIIFKKTKKGKKFYGCSNYPKCDFASWRKEQIKPI